VKKLKMPYMYRYHRIEISIALLGDSDSVSVGEKYRKTDAATGAQ
jgi:hypothetical protein